VQVLHRAALSGAGDVPLAQVRIARRPLAAAITQLLVGPAVAEREVRVIRVPQLQVLALDERGVVERAERMGVERADVLAVERQIAARQLMRRGTGERADDDLIGAVLLDALGNPAG
jgi:hypothetical protein